VWFCDLYADGLDQGVVFQDREGYSFGDRFGQVDGRPFNDTLRPQVNVAIVNRLGEVVGEPRGLQIEVKLDIYDEGLA
jgi:hypothetical protein